MIAYLKGYLEEKHENHILMDVQGVGYKVEISSVTLEQLDNAGSELKILIYHHITEGDQRLFGFYTREEKKLFEKLITIKGVGPKLGLTILSGLPADKLIRAIVDEDSDTLSRIPGIGKKTSQRIILELKDKLGDEISGLSTGSATGAGSSGMVDEAVSALVSLGYRKTEAEKAVLKALKQEEGADLSAVVKASLALLKK